jgi:hypothetical protein
MFVENDRVVEVPQGGIPQPTDLALHAIRVGEPDRDEGAVVMDAPVRDAGGYKPSAHRIQRGRGRHVEADVVEMAAAQRLCSSVRMRVCVDLEHDQRLDGDTAASTSTDVRDVDREETGADPLAHIALSVAGDPEFRRWFDAAGRRAASPGVPRTSIRPSWRPMFGGWCPVSGCRCCSCTVAAASAPTSVTPALCRSTSRWPDWSCSPVPMSCASSATPWRCFARSTHGSTSFNRLRMEIPTDVPTYGAGSSGRGVSVSR